jgi:hypothetical protein
MYDAGLVNIISLVPLLTSLAKLLPTLIPVFTISIELSAPCRFIFTLAVVFTTSIGGSSFTTTGFN